MLVKMPVNEFYIFLNEFDAELEAQDLWIDVSASIDEAECIKCRKPISDQLRVGTVHDCFPPIVWEK